MRPKILVFSFLLFSAGSHGQPAGGEREAIIVAHPEDGGFRFSALAPPLRPIAGAPAPFYGYFWEFGDGSFSFEESPLHYYAQPGEYETRLYLTNNYDDGKRPPGRPRKVYAPPSLLADRTPATEMPPVVEAGRALRLQANHSPRPEEEIVCIVSYRNLLDRPTDGRLYLFFNERRFGNQHFEAGDYRAHHGEKPLPDEESLGLIRERSVSLNAWARREGNPAETFQDPFALALDEARSRYQDRQAWRFTELKPDEERHLFLTLPTTAAMLADTNALITIQGFFAPDAGLDFETFTLEMEIVASHDPNRLAVSTPRLNFRRARDRSFTYRARFQNTGEGPARRIEVSCDLPPGLDPAALQILDYSPFCPLCPDETAAYSCLDTTFQEGRIVFTFRNIYLPGSRQEGFRDRDSTRGFIKYQLPTGRNIKRFDLAPRAAIVFDKNPPITTNRATTDFTGWAPALKAGANLYASNGRNAGFFLGLSYSPFKPRRYYYQPELMAYFERLEAAAQDECPAPGTALPGPVILSTSSQERRSVFLDLVPLQLRRDLSSFLGLGLGAQLTAEVYRQTREERRSDTYFFTEDGRCLGPEAVGAAESSSGSRWFPDFSPALFADVHLGRVRLGPAAGIRFLYPLDEEPLQWQLYAGWKF